MSCGSYRFYITCLFVWSGLSFFARSHSLSLLFSYSHSHSHSYWYVTSTPFILFKIQNFSLPFHVLFIIDRASLVNNLFLFLSLFFMMGINNDSEPLTCIFFFPRNGDFFFLLFESIAFSRFVLGLY